MSDDEVQTSAEVLAHLESVVQPAWDWIAALTAGDHLAMWELSDDEYRTCRSQAWLWNNRHILALDQGALDAELARFVNDPGSSEEWDNFSTMEIDGYRNAWSNFDLDQLGAASRPRPVALDYEIVVLSNELQGQMITEPTLIQAVVFLMHHVDGAWLVNVAGSDRRSTPGWPPEFAQPSR